MKLSAIATALVVSTAVPAWSQAASFSKEGAQQLLHGLEVMSVTEAGGDTITIYSDGDAIVITAEGPDGGVCVVARKNWSPGELI